MSRITPTRKNYRYFQDPAGFPVFLCGAEGSDLLTRANSEFRESLLQLEGQGINLLHLRMETLDRDPIRWLNPFKRVTGNARTGRGFRRFNLSALNPAYGDRLRSLVKIARLSGIYVQVSLFPNNGEFEVDVRWAESAWNPANNVNGKALGESFSEAGREGLHPFYQGSPATDEESFIVEAQKALVESILDAAEFPHVFFHLGGGPKIPAEWVKKWLAFVDERTDAPVLADVAYAGKIKELDGFNRFPDQLEAGSSPVDSGKIVFAHSIPTDEEAVSDIRLLREAWGALLSGEQPIQELFTENDGTEGRSLREAQAHNLSAIRRFLRDRRVRFWTMLPRLDLAAGQPCLSRADERYLALPAQDGSVTLDLTETSGSFTVAWWNVKDEILTTQGMVLGGGSRNFTAPDTGVWVLDLFKKLQLR